MAKTKLDFDRLAKAGHSPAEILKIVQSLETAGVSVNLQVNGPEGMKLLGQLPVLQKQERQAHLGMASLLVVGVLASLIPLLYGLVSLLP